MFVLGDFNIHHKDWLIYFGGANRSANFYYNFSILNDLTQMVNFPTWIPDCDSHSPGFFGFISSFWSYYLFYKGFPYCEILIKLLP